MNRLYILIFALILSSITVAQNIVTVSGLNATVDNGVIKATIAGGRMSSLTLPGQSNIYNGGGWGYFSYNGDSGFYTPTSATPQVKTNNDSIADIYYVNTSDFRVEMHYVFRRGESGFYTYMVVSDAGKLNKSIGELRFGVRVDKNVFDRAWTVERDEPMIHPDTLANYTEQIGDATYRLQDGSVYCKYDWSVYRIYDQMHGLMGDSLGIWSIEASREYMNGGTTNQDLTVHGTNTTPISLTYFLSGHYGCDQITTRDEYSAWSKIYGPSFNYINSGTRSDMIADAKLKAEELTDQWPYPWLDHPLYPLERGTLSGKLQMKGNGEVDSAMVLLCKSGPSWKAENEHWQYQPYDYLFWDEADADGGFSINNIRPGTYDLYAYTQKGKLIDELKMEDVVVSEGMNSLDSVVWDANDKQKIIFQVGTADHKSGEFKLGNLPRYYARSEGSPLRVSYSPGTSDPKVDWYYCQRENSNWYINLDLPDTSSFYNPTLKIAIAGSDVNPHLDVIVGGEKVIHHEPGSDSGIRRHSMTGGKFSMVSVTLDKTLFKEGYNQIKLYCYGGDAYGKGIMYDAVLLEADTTLVPEKDTTTIPETGVGVDFDVHEAKPRVFSVEGGIAIESFSTESYQVRIYSITGSLIYQSQIRKGMNTLSLNTKGVVIVNLYNNRNTYTSKAISR